MFKGFFGGNKACKSITGEDAKTYIEEKKAIIVDVREQSEYLSGHIEGALNIPLAGIQLNSANLLKDKEQIIILHCLSGGRSARACSILTNLGYTNIYNLGGIGNWKEKLV